MTFVFSILRYLHSRILKTKTDNIVWQNEKNGLIQLLDIKVNTNEVFQHCYNDELVNRNLKKETFQEMAAKKTQCLIDDYLKVLGTSAHLL